MSQSAAIGVNCLGVERGGGGRGERREGEGEGEGEKVLQSAAV